MSVYKYEITDNNNNVIEIQYSSNKYTHTVVAYGFSSHTWGWDGMLFVSEQRAVTEAKRRNKNLGAGAVYIPTEVRSTFFCKSEEEFNALRNAGKVEFLENR